MRTCTSPRSWWNRQRTRPSHSVRSSALLFACMGTRRCGKPFRANSLPYAFQAAIFTREIDTALGAAAELDASAVMINDHTAFRTDWMPFAGRRQSGYGIGGIPYTMHDMTQEKMLVLRYAPL